MLFPRPPAPVDRRREVAAAVVAHKQAATIAPGHVLQIPGKPAPAVQADPPDRRAGLERQLSRDGDDTPV